jgi:signal transduction histidine kinase
MAIELHRRQCAAGPASESLEVALRQLRLMESYLQRFMALGRDQPKTSQNVLLAAVVDDALSLVRPACVHAGIDLEFMPSAQPFRVRGDPDALRQLTVNLVLNAVEAAGRQNGSRPRITVALESAGEGRAALHVRDTGPGPSPEVADRLFEPFVSGKPEGTGLGLYVARQVAEDHHGSIAWQRHDGETHFTVELPTDDAGKREVEG